MSRSSARQGSPWLRLCARGMQCLAMLALLPACSSVNSMLGGNTSKQALADIKYSADPRGLRMDIHASKSLNVVSGTPYALTIAVIQSNNPKAALKLANNAAELDQLLTGVPSTDPAILSVDRFVVQPGAIDTLVLARRQEAQVVLVYAGYYNSPVTQRVRMLEVPIFVDKSGVFVTTYAASPAVMNLSLVLSEVMVEELSLLGPSPFVFPNPDNNMLNGGRPTPDPAGDKVMQL
ncbi:MAG: hypothetical protein RLY91_1584 [Pseudomonadota bacterium]|jgi:predicted component of type VI protein secretion system